MSCVLQENRQIFCFNITWRQNGFFECQNLDAAWSGESYNSTGQLNWTHILGNVLYQNIKFLVKVILILPKLFTHFKSPMISCMRLDVFSIVYFRDLGMSHKNRQKKETTNNNFRDCPILRQNCHKYPPISMHFLTSPPQTTTQVPQIVRT